MEQPESSPKDFEKMQADYQRDNYPRLWEALESVRQCLIEHQEDMPPGFQKVINEHFWEMVAKKNKYEIGDQVIDEDGCTGIVGIRYTDGDFVTFENNAAHPNPRKIDLDTTGSEGV